MAFLDEQHENKITNIENLWESLEEISELAREYGIIDIFQDNGAKVLQQLIYLNFQNLPGREGNDALDDNNVEWEMKSINIATSARSFSTNHHLNYDILEKYRQIPWSFAIYEGINLLEIYVMSPQDLEPWFSRFEQQLNEGRTHLNNPKIPIKFVRENGTQVYPIDDDDPKNPIDIY